MIVKIRHKQLKIRTVSLKNKPEKTNLSFNFVLFPRSFVNFQQQQFKNFENEAK